MIQRLKRFLPDILIIAGLFIVPLLLFWQQTLGGRTLLPVDNLYAFEPYASMAEEAGITEPHNALISDLILENYAWKLTIDEQLKQGQLPLWQRAIVGGAPFLAAGQSSSLYPFTLLTLFIFPISASYGWFTVLTLWMAGINMYIFVRVLGIGRAGGLISALAYQLSAFFIVSITFQMIIATAAWLPLCLAMVEKTIRQDAALGDNPASLPWVVVGAGALGLAGLAGHVEALYFTLLVMGFYAAWRLAAYLVEHRREKGVVRYVLRRCAWLLALVILGVGLGAIQILPSYELASRSFREGAVTLGQVRGWAYPARRVIAFVMPNFFGNPSHHRYFDVFRWMWVDVTTNAAGDPINNTSWGIKNYVEGGAYMGILPMTLALLAVVHWGVSRLNQEAVVYNGPTQESSRFIGHEAADRPYRVLFGTLSVLSVAFIFGTPLYAIIFYGLPFINQSHSPFRWVWPLTLCVSVLAGFGVQVIEESASNGVEARRAVPLPKIIGFVSVLGGATLIGGLIISRLMYPSIEGTVQRVFEGLALAPNAFADGHAFYSYQFANAAILALVLLGAGIVFLLSLAAWHLPGRLKPVPVWLAAAVGLVIVDLSVATWGFYPANDPDLLTRQPDSIAFLSERYAADLAQGKPWRYIVYEEAGRDTMNSNIGWLHGLEDASGYDSLIPGQYADYMRLIQTQDDLQYNRIAPIYEPQALDSPLLDLLNVRYVVTESEIESPKFQRVYQDEAVSIYENLGALPRAFTLPAYSTVYVESGPTSLAMEDAVRLYDVRQRVLLEPIDSLFTPSADLPAINTDDCNAEGDCAGDISPAAITVYDARSTWVDVQVDEPGWLIVTDSYFPGWRAFVRPFDAGDDAEEEVDVHLVNGNFQGVLLDEGAWTVRLTYSPDSVRLGGFISFMAGMLLVFGAMVYVWRYAYRDSAEGTTAYRVAKNSLTPILLNLFNRGIQFAFAIVSLRILGPQGSGRYQYAVVLWGWFEIVSNFGLDTLLMREVSRAKDEANKYLANTSLMRFVLALLGVPLLWGFLYARQTLLDPPLAQETVTAIWVLYIGLFLSTMSKGLTGLFYAYEKAEYPAALQTISTMLSASLGVVALLMGYGIVGLAVVSVLTNAITLTMLYFLTRRMFFVPRIRFDGALQKMAAGESFPLMINHLLATIFFRIDIILLELLTRSDAIIGWYGVTYKWVDAINVIPAFFTQALFPVMSRQASEDTAALKRSYIFSVKLLTVVSVPGAVVTTLLAPVLVGILGGPEFLPYGAIALQIFIWSIPFGWINSVTNYVIIALNRQRILTWAFVFGAAFNIAGNLYFIPKYSFPAAAAMTILSEFVLLAFFYMVLLKPLGRINWAGTLWRIVLPGAVMGGVVYFTASINMWLALAAGIVVYAVCVFLLRPFDAYERERLMQLVPEKVRVRFAESNVPILASFRAMPVEAEEHQQE